MKPQRKRSKGIYYTPQLIARYLTNKALVYLLRRKANEHSLEDLINSYEGQYEKLIQMLQSLKILDPACGEGVFIKSAIQSLAELYSELHLSRINDEPPLRKEILKSELFEQIIKDNVYGVDNNKDAIEFIRQELIGKLNNTNKKNLLSNIRNSFIMGNSIVTDSSLARDGIDWDLRFQSIMQEGGFDIIVGNPPWGADLEAHEEYFREHYPEIAKGQFDSFAIFLYLSIKDMLKDGGVLAFIIPNELLLLEQYSSLRAYLLNYRILELVNLGFDIFPDEIQKPALLLIIKKIRFESCESRQNNDILVRVNLSNKEKMEFLKNKISLGQIIHNKAFNRDQRDFIKNAENRFDIFSRPIDRKIKQKIEANEFKPLKVYFINGRGMDTNIHGRHLVCPDCGCLNPPFGRGHSGRISKKNCINPACGFIFLKKDKEKYATEDLILEELYKEGEHHAPGYIGRDLHRFYFSRSPRLVKYYGGCYEENQYFKYSFVGWKDPELYKGEKLMVRKVSTGHLPQVMISEDFLVGNQQIYFFKKKDQFREISIYFYLGILTSRLIHYYYLKEFGDPDKDMMPHFTQSNLKKLPIPKPDRNEGRYKVLIRNTKQIISLANKYHSEESEKSSLMTEIHHLFKQLDEIVFHYYNIDNPHYRQRIIEVANQNGFRVL